MHPCIITEREQDSQRAMPVDLATYWMRGSPESSAKKTPVLLALSVFRNPHTLLPILTRFGSIDALNHRTAGSAGQTYRRRMDIHDIVDCAGIAAGHRNRQRNATFLTPSNHRQIPLDQSVFGQF
ncbi:hypothetical protein Poly51_08940 [Rubripirellula tenax]|uniref:Uncharacterized protein n=1 Tax=Rubripirellula tenax TaxID=2528015 RepID=A0A5C6FFN3_9BACT|nr:hypothetical protein Poly51_08940 [Rubripirellula tenax]